MIRHIVMANFKAEVGQHKRDEFAKKVVETFAQISGGRNIIASQASGIAGTIRYDAALFIDFENEATLKGYLDHPIHKAVEAQMPEMFSDFLISNYQY